ncbi:MAG TPA: GAF domain-containing sensor histidine kinase [Anaerolineae bacterium]|nr:GAF domain-containing sensor histidine kinase [Anaerolineae bacterium]
MSATKLRGLSILIPVLFAAIVVHTAHCGVLPALSRNLKTVLATGLVLAASLVFSRFMFYLVDRMNRQIEQQAERAEALLEVAQAINSSLEVKVILQRAVDLARAHLNADFGEIHFLVEPEGEHGVRFSGLHKGQCPVKQKPTLRGLNGEVLRTGNPLRLDDRRVHPQSIDLPEGHPPIGPFLGVPIMVQGQTQADILLIRAPGSPPFTQEDENFLLTMANQVAVAVENADLYQKVRHVAALEERDWLSREIHDGLAQTLAYLSLQTRAVADLVAAGHLDKAQTSLSEVRNVIKHTYEEVRRAIFDLRASPDPDLDFVSALREYLYEFGLQSQINVELEVDDEDLHLSPTVEVQLTRIIQEALTNVRRHAGAQQAWVRLASTSTGYQVSIEDDGRGFDPTTSRSDGWPHFGLQTMRERAESVDGRLHVRSRPGQGTQVIVDLPTNGYERQIRETGENV